MKTLTTDRLILRDLKITDIDDVYTYAKKHNIGTHAGWRPHKDKNETVKIVKSLIEQTDVYAIVDKKTSKVIGTLGVHKDEKRKNPFARSLGFVLSDKYWGKGLMTEACTAVIEYVFMQMNMIIITVTHFPYNERSKRVIEKLGFNYEGRLKKSFMRFDGEVLDEDSYSMTKEEYLDLN